MLVITKDMIVDTNSFPAIYITPSVITVKFSIIFASKFTNDIGCEDG